MLLFRHAGESTRCNNKNITVTKEVAGTGDSIAPFLDHSFFGNTGDPQGNGCNSSECCKPESNLKQGNQCSSNDRGLDVFSNYVAKIHESLSRSCFEYEFADFRQEAGRDTSGHQLDYAKILRRVFGHLDLCILYNVQSS